MEARLNDLKFAMRMLTKDRGVTLVAVLTLALGIGANTALFSVVKAVVLNALPYAQADRLVSLATGGPADLRPTTVDFTTTFDFRARSRSFDHVVLFRGWSRTNVGAGETELIRGQKVGYDFFDTLGVKMQLGRSFRPEEDAPKADRVLVLSHGLWLRRFGGDAGIVGRSVQLNGASYEVAGVLPAGFRPLRPNADSPVPEMYSPLGYALGEGNACRGCQHLQAIARLKPGVSVAQAQAELDAITRALVAEHPTDYDSRTSVLVEPLAQRIVGRTQTPLWILFGAVGFVLLIACANVANLLLARAAGRGRELALRTALGASRARLVKQLLVESLLIAAVGGALGVLLAVWGTSLLVSVGPREIPRLEEVGIDWSVLAFSLAVTLGTGVLFGLVPALRASRVEPSATLKEGGRALDSGARHGLRSALVASELALAFVLVVGTALLGKSFLRLVQVDPGFDPRGVVTMGVHLWGERYQKAEAEVGFYRQVMEELRARPGVEAVGMVSTIPFDGFDQRGFHIQDRPLANPSEAPSVDHYSVTPDYLRVMRIPLKRGRMLSEADDANAPRVALVSESTARLVFPGEDPIGRHVQFGGRDEKQPWATIVGVVGDVQQYGLDHAPTPQSYAPQAQDVSFGYSLFVRTTRSAASLEPELRAIFRGLDKTQPVQPLVPLETYLRGSLAERRFTLALLAGMGALGLLMAAVGAYGVVSYAVSLRTREVGIRMALGAQSAELLAMVMRQGLWLAAAGLGVGFAASLALTRVLSSLLFEVHPMDPAAFLAVAALLAAVVLAATWLPARRATRVNPLVALRYE
ncbi:MAG: ABC transporter permease [Burkholderiales bacterium]